MSNEYINAVNLELHKSNNNEIRLMDCHLNPSRERLMEFNNEIKNSNATNLRLYSYNIGSNISYFIEGLKMNMYITDIAISSCNLGSKGLKILCTALKKTKVSKLSVDYVIGSEKILRNLLLNSSIRNFILTYVPKGLGYDINFLSDVFIKGNLTHIELNYLCPNNQILQSLSLNNTLTHIVLREPGRNSRECEERTLGWEPQHIDYKYLCQSLQKNRTIRKIKIIDKINNDVAKYFAELLQVSVTIESLKLFLVQFDWQGIKYLCDALKINRKLESLIISNDPFSFNGIIEAIQYFSETLLINKTLKKLGLNGFVLGRDSLQYLATILNQSSLKEFHFSEPLNYLGNMLYNHSDSIYLLFDAISTNNSLNSLHLYFNFEDSSQSIDRISNNKFLRDLKISNGNYNYVLNNHFKSKVNQIVQRNITIHNKVVNAAIYIIGIRYGKNCEGMGDLYILPKDIVKMIAMELFRTKGDEIWLK